MEHLYYIYYIHVRVGRAPLGGISFFLNGGKYIATFKITSGCLQRWVEASYLFSKNVQLCENNWILLYDDVGLRRTLILTESTGGTRNYTFRISIQELNESVVQRLGRASFSACIIIHAINYRTDSRCIPEVWCWWGDCMRMRQNSQKTWEFGYCL